MNTVKLGENVRKEVRKEEKDETEEDADVESGGVREALKG